MKLRGSLHSPLPGWIPPLTVACFAAVIICDGARPRFPKINPDVDAGFCEFHYWNNERCRCELQFDNPARVDARRAGSA